MKTLLRALLIYIPLLLAFECKAQLTGGDAFIKTKYVEVGICSTGVLGSVSTPPDGYHPNVDARLALVADPAKDGWTVATHGDAEYMGDYILPGSPFERWDLQIGNSLGSAFNSVSPSPFAGGLYGENTGISSSGGVSIGEWRGIKDSLQIKQEVSVGGNTLAAQFVIKIKNTSHKKIDHIYYHRLVDPDNDEPWPGGGFSTYMKIENQISSSSGYSLVSATGNYPNSYYGIYSTDCRSKVYYSSHWPAIYSPDSLYSGVGLSSAYYSIILGDSAYGDYGMGIVFNVGTLNAGDSTELHFSYILDKLDFKKNFSYKGKDYSDKDTIYACKGTVVEVVLNNNVFTDWVWESSPYLSDTLGAVNEILIDGNRTFTAIRTLSICGGNWLDTIHIVTRMYDTTRPKVHRIGSVIYVDSIYAKCYWYWNNLILYDEPREAFSLTDKGYYYAIIIDTNGCTLHSDSLYIDAETASLKEFGSKENITLFPNPTSDKLYFEGSSPMDVTLFDMLGRTVLKAKATNSIDLSAYPDGFYIIKLFTAEGKLIDQRKILKRQE